MMKLTKILIIFCSLLLINNLAKADHNQHVFEQANKLYQQEQYEDAILKYLEIINNGYESWELYYNLGNAYYRIGQFGKSILHFERAYKLNPKNEDVEFNLRLVNTKVVDNIKMPPLTIFFNNIKGLLSKTALIWLTIGLYLGLTFLFIMKLIIRKMKFQRLMKLVLVPVLIVLIASASLLILRINEDVTVKCAILMINKVDVLGEPSESGTELFSLHEGAKFKIEEYSGAWAKIRLADGNVGWIKKDVFEVI